MAASRVCGGLLLAALAAPAAPAAVVAHRQLQADGSTMVTDYVNPVIDELKTVAIEIDGVEVQHTIYRLSLELTNAAATNVYTIFGVDGSPMNMPAAWQSDGLPCDEDTGGVNPELIAYFPLCEYDSWLTVGITEGANTEVNTRNLPFGAFAAFAAKTLPLPRFFTAFAAKTLHLPRVFHCLRG